MQMQLQKSGERENLWCLAIWSVHFVLVESHIVHYEGRVCALPGTPFEDRLVDQDGGRKVLGIVGQFPMDMDKTSFYQNVHQLK